MSLERGTSARLSLKNFSRKLSLRNKDYSKVEDLYDTRVPLHNEDAFGHGLKFKAKFIGSLEISRPTCKVDIITAMRRIRYEFKVKGIRKVRSTLEISTQGVKVTKRKRKRSRKYYTEEQLFIMQHPIYRIFYVSHDSQDMKIFSYITRELPDSTFRCNVFKAYKKNMALHIVRSLGQAFDVCHRLNPRPKKSKKGEEESEEDKEKKEGEETKTKEGEEGEQKEGANTSVELGTELGRETTKPQKQQDVHKDLMDLDFDPFNSSFTAPVPTATLPNGAPQMAFESNFTSGSGAGAAASGTGFPPFMVSNNANSGLPDLPEGTARSPSGQTQLPTAGRPRPRPSATQQQQNIIQENPFTDTIHTGSESPSVSIGEAIDGLSNPFMVESLASGRGGHPPSMWELQKQQMMAQMALMQEQLKQETAARIESQARVEHLLGQNKELLTHVQKLMVELEKLQSLQMAQLMASGIKPPDLSASPVKPTSSSPPSSSSSSTPAPSSLPAIPEISVEKHAVQPPAATTSPSLPAILESPVEKPSAQPPAIAAGSSSLPAIAENLATHPAEEDKVLLESAAFDPVLPSEKQVRLDPPSLTPPPSSTDPFQPPPATGNDGSYDAAFAPSAVSPKTMTSDAAATTGSSTNTTTMSTDSEQLLGPVDFPPNQSGEPEMATQRSSTPLSGTSDPPDPVLAPLVPPSSSSPPDTSNLPTNDPFTPQ